MELKRINSYTYEFPKCGDMNIPFRIYASAELLEKIRQDKTLQQARNMTCLPGILQTAYVMPDAHQGYGFPIGGVAAFDAKRGIISPGGVGYDINCGVRLLKTEYTVEDIGPHRKKLLETIFGTVPAGVGRGGATPMKKGDFLEVCARGGQWAVENGYATEEDLERTEENGRMPEADPDSLSSRAIERGIPQLGTLGAGNHFLEIQRVERIYDRDVALAFGMHDEGQVMVMIHCGSRGFGHQVASDYIHWMENELGHKGLPDRELINAPIESKLGKRYYGAMCAAVNYAFTNRQIIAHRVREAFGKVMGSSEGMSQVYDVCHNVAKMERHRIGGGTRQVCVHRKGATRSFGPGREEIPEVYRRVGQPVLIPGSMGTASYVLVGTPEAEKLSFGSTAHGAGRVMSRNQARKRFKAEKIARELDHRGIDLMSASRKCVSEEASGAYKDVEEVVRVSHEVGIGRMVARLRPEGVIKG
ncbi:RNA-splicing ligase RtcB [Candidatus Fermentibacteria bacterium]|nr:RNA-splicing ligase RtcB [Candidatus Fermentibacteria bacterium]